MECQKRAMTQTPLLVHTHTESILPRNAFLCTRRAEMYYAPLLVNYICRKYICRMGQRRDSINGASFLLSPKFAT